MTATDSTHDRTGDYTLDPAHTRIGFSARHAMATKVHDAFHDFDGHAHFDTEDPARSTIVVAIRTASIDTGNDQRDGHLRSNDFLSMDEYPEITFTSTDIKQAGDDVYQVTGELTIKDVSRPISIDFEFSGSAVDPYGNVRIGFEGHTTINRKDWNVTWNAPLEAGGVLVSDKVTLEFDVSAIKVQPGAA